MAQHDQFLHFVDLFRDIIKDKTYDLNEKIDGIYSMLKEQILGVQQQNDKLIENVKEAQNEMARQKNEIYKLNAENGILTALNEATDVKVAAMGSQNQLIVKQLESLTTKMGIIELPSPSAQAHSEFEIGSTSDKLSKEMEDVNSELQRIQEKIKTIGDFQANLNSKVEELEAVSLTSAIEVGEEKESVIGVTLKATRERANQFVKKINELDSHLKSFGSIAQQQNDYKSHCLTWKIAGIKEVISKSKHSIESEEFPVHGYPFKAKAKFAINNLSVFMSLAFTDERNKGREIPLKVVPRVTYTLKDLSGTDKDVVCYYDHLLRTSTIFDSYGNETWLTYKSLLVNSSYGQNDSVIIDIAIDPPSVASVVASNDAILKVAIDNFKLRKQKAIDKLELYHSSPHFNTSPTGFTVQANMWLNGYADFEGKGLKIEILFLRGENDLYLPRSFGHKTTVILFNQLDSSKHYTTTAENNIKHNVKYFIDLLPHDKIESDGFLKNDTLHYKIIIEPIIKVKSIFNVFG